MRSSNKRSRSKSNRPKTLGNIVNRVFDSSGPEGKVRGTPQQIIEKYQLLARDAQLSNDRVAAENFQQHAEHYTRMLAQATREMQAEQDARRQNQDDRARQFPDDRRGQDDRRPAHDTRAQDTRAQHSQRRNDYRAGDDDDGPRSDSSERSFTAREPAAQGAFAVQDTTGSDSDEATLVETPESRAFEAPPPAPQSSDQPETGGDNAAPVAREEAPAKPANRRKPRAPKPADATKSAEAPKAADAADSAPAEQPKPKRAPRRPRKPAPEGSDTSTPSSSAAE